MSYKYSAGDRELGDIKYEGDPAETQIDFEDDFIALKTGGNQVLIVSGSNVGVGIAVPGYNLHIAGASSAVTFIDGAANTDAFLRLGNGGVLKSYIKHGSGGNLVITNETADKDIIFNVKDATTEREALRINGDVAEVVVNEGSDSLVDFRVESNNSTHMLFVDGGNDTVGVGTSTPGSALHVNASFATAITGKTSNYTLTGGDHTILVSCSSGNVTLTLPTAVGCTGRMYIIKRIDDSANAANINSNGSENIEGSTDSASVPGMSSIVLQSDGSGWWKVAEYIKAP
jgi:hypothetical protein